jgi:hypothetical protein
MTMRAAPVMRASLALSALLILPPCLRAQEAPKPFRYDWNGHASFVLGTCWHGYTLTGGGGGGEVFVWRGLTLGGDLAAQRFVEGDPVFGLLSTNVGYHWVNRQRPARFDPFIHWIIGGAFTEDLWTGAHGMGGGLNYWFREGMGLRTEARFQVAGNAEEGLLMFRIGLSFR